MEIFIQKAKELYFLLVAVLMYYFITEVINLGLFVTFRHAFALVLFASALLFFLFRPNIARGLVAFRSAVWYSLPLAVTIFASLFIWFMGQVDVSVISRGLSGAFVYNNMLSFALAAGAILYVFGERGIWYNLIAILVANILMILTIMMQYGVGSYVSELVALITSFAAVTGDIIVQAEVHELAFCLGAYLIYMLLKPKKNIVFYILMALTLFCFLSAFKRIGMIAIVVAMAFGWGLHLISKFRKETAKNLTVFLSLLLCVILVGYIAAIKLDVFALLEQIGIETSGRVVIYHAVDRFYEFTPEFLGNGIGFLTYQLSSGMNVGVSSVHNDFLQYYIDLGFWGYLLWLLSMTVARVCYFGRKGRIDNAILCLCLSIYLLIVSSTDNTMNYPLLTAVLAVLMIGDGFDKEVRETEQKMFAHISEENKAKQGRKML